LSGKVFEFELQASGEKVHGSIQPKDVAEFIAQKFRIPISKKHIDFG